MSTSMFLFLLAAFSTISSLVTEGIKKLVKDKQNLAINLVALAVALVVGSGGTICYYILNAIELSVANTVYALLMGFASGLVSMVGFDKVKQAILQLKGDNNES